MTKEEIANDFEDLGLVVATKEEAFWKKAKEETDVQIAGLERALKFNKAVLEMIEKKIEDEKQT